jgi:hypothetical protein
MQQLSLTILEQEYSIHRLNAGADIPPEVLACHFYSITKTDDELSIVCPSAIKVAGEKVDSGWCCIKVCGILDLTLTGILAGLTAALAEAKISVFAFSTYDTDYLLVKQKAIGQARKVLEYAGHIFV